MLLALLQMPEVQISQLATSKSAPQQDGENGPVPLPISTFRFGRAKAVQDRRFAVIQVGRPSLVLGRFGFRISLWRVCSFQPPPSRLAKSLPTLAGEMGVLQPCEGRHSQTLADAPVLIGLGKRIGDYALTEIRRFRLPRSRRRQTTPVELVDKNDVRDDLLPVVLWTDGRRLLFLIYGSEGVVAGSAYS